MPLVKRKTKPFCPLYDQKLTEFSEHAKSELHRLQVRLAHYEALHKVDSSPTSSPTHVQGSTSHLSNAGMQFSFVS